MGKNNSEIQKKSQKFLQALISNREEEEKKKQNKTNKQSQANKKDLDVITILSTFTENQNFLSNKNQ